MGNDVDGQKDESKQRTSADKMTYWRALPIKEASKNVVQPFLKFRVIFSLTTSPRVD